MKNKKTIFIIIGVILVLAVAGSFLFYQNGVSAVSSQDEEVIVQVESGSGASQILNALDQAGLVNNKLCGQLFLKLNSFKNLQANTYILNKNMSLSNIFKIIENPDFKYILKSELKVADGNTIPTVAQAFADTLDITKEEVMKQWADKSYLKSLIKDYWFIDESILDKNIMYPLEGYLYPDTYYITEEKPTIQSLTKVSLDAMDKVLTKYKDDIQKLNWTPHQFLSFVSVVERESLFDEDKSQIAGVFMNRLKQGMLLQSDITVNYALQRTGVQVSIKQTQVDSRYNTYKYTGLPVGPISTVLEKTMESCIKYTSHNYLYFFAKEDGKVIYSETYAEHEKAVKENKWY